MNNIGDIIEPAIKIIINNKHKNNSKIKSQYKI